MTTNTANAKTRNPLLAPPSPPVQLLPEAERRKRFKPIEARLKAELRREAQPSLARAYQRGLDFVFIQDQQIPALLGFTTEKDLCEGLYLNDSEPDDAEHKRRRGRSTGYEYAHLPRRFASDWIEEAGDKVTVRDALLLAKPEVAPVDWILRLEWEALMGGAKQHEVQWIIAAVDKVIVEYRPGQPLPTEAALRKLIDEARAGTPAQRLRVILTQVTGSASRLYRTGEPLEKALSEVPEKEKDQALTELKESAAPLRVWLDGLLGEQGPSPPQKPAAAPAKAKEVPKTGPASPESGRKGGGRASPESGQVASRKVSPPPPAREASRKVSPESGRNAERKPSPDSGREASPKPSPDSGRKAERKVSPDSGKNAERKPSPDSGRKADPKPSPDSGRKADRKASPDLTSFGPFFAAVALLAAPDRESMELMLYRRLRGDDVAERIARLRGPLVAAGAPAELVGQWADLLCHPDRERGGLFALWFYHHAKLPGFRTAVLDLRERQLSASLARAVEELCPRRDAWQPGADSG